MVYKLLNTYDLKEFEVALIAAAIVGKKNLFFTFRDAESKNFMSCQLTEELGFIIKPLTGKLLKKKQTEFDKVIDKKFECFSESIEKLLSHIQDGSIEFYDKLNVQSQAERSFHLISYSFKKKNISEAEKILSIWSDAVIFRQKQFKENLKRDKTYLISEIGKIHLDLCKAFTFFNSLREPSEHKSIFISWENIDWREGNKNEILNPYTISWLSSDSGQLLLKKILLSIKYKENADLKIIFIGKNSSRWGLGDVYKIEKDGMPIGLMPLHPELFTRALNSCSIQASLDYISSNTITLKVE
jgi:hypothetical protein